MSRMASWAIVTFLAVATIGHGYYSYAQNDAKQAPTQGPWAEQDQWISTIRERLFQREPVHPQQFDMLFDDKFFGRRSNPFEDIERFHATDTVNIIFKRLPKHTPGLYRGQTPQLPAAQI